jgi:hypothetical protein
MKTKITRNLPNNAYEAATNANNPSASNPFITEVESAVGSASLLLYLLHRLHQQFLLIVS